MTIAILMEDHASLLEKFKQQHDHDNSFDPGYDETLSIIHNLGGLKNIIELCLSTQSYCKQNIQKDELHQLNKLLLLHESPNNDNATENVSNKPMVIFEKTDLEFDVKFEIKENLDQETKISSPTTSTAVLISRASDSSVSSTNDHYHHNINYSYSNKSSKKHNNNKNSIYQSTKLQSNSPSLQHTNIINSNNNNNNSNNNSNINNSNNQNKRNPTMMGSIRPFYKHNNIFVVDAKRCLYFKIFSNDIACYIYYNILLQKRFVLAIVILSVLFVTIGSIIRDVGNQDIKIFAGYTFTIVGYLMASFFTIAYLFAFNIDICKVLIRSFEFWYKIYNLIIYCVANVVIWNGRQHNGFDSRTILALRWLILVLSCPSWMFLSLLDAMYLSIETKLIILGATVAWLIYACADHFFGIDETDYNWNPFGSQYTNINFKSVALFAVTNLTFFLVKPFLLLLLTKMSPTRYNTQNNRIQRCPTVYKYPYFEWVNVKN